MKSAKKIPQYDHKKVEKKWQKEWEKKKTFAAKDNSSKSKFYGLIEFPYPSGDGLHVGHIRSNTAMDIIARKRRAEGYEVLYPIGWDAFGLPTENYAIKTGVAPQVVTKKNTDTFRRQLKALGFSFDWDREINTTSPEYYKWTQWIFLQMFKKGLAYKKRMAINWCPKDKIGLANEEVIDGKCERCGTEVELREKEQWMLAITKYADRLDKDLDTVDFLPKIKTQQRNWIGRSEGVNFKCKIKDLGIDVEMYNSVPQTYRAETFTVIAPDHSLVSKLVDGTPQEKEVVEFVDKIKKKKMSGAFDIEKEMDGIFTGRYIENYAGTGRDLPIWIASYAIADYGTGIVNCSAHDTRDYAFAKKYSIPLHEVAEALFIKTDGPDAFRINEPVVDRSAVVCVIRDPNTEKYLCLKWKQNDWKGFVIGGIENGESAESAGKREIAEETGYKNVRYIGPITNTVHSKFYQSVKKINRFAHFTPVLFELVNNDHDEIGEKEKELHEVLWLSKKEVDEFLNREDMQFIWDRHIDRAHPIIKNGILREPDVFVGREWFEVRGDIVEYLTEKGYAEPKAQYKLRDWVFSRQRYWGEPIPLVFCASCAKASEGKENAGWVAVPDEKLPVKLPKVEKYQPTETGESPLAAIEKWVKTKCPVCGGKARRETDTMPNWAGSSWYYLRYVDPENKQIFADKNKLTYWTPVDWYNGGMEHTTLHLLYSRFWHKFLFDQGYVPTSEPYLKRTSHGLILAEGGVKMSKSKGNVINPDSIVEAAGADALRLYEMFMAPFAEPVAWSNDGVVGTKRFLDRVWRMGHLINDVQTESTSEITSLVNNTVKKVSDDIEAMKFNTAVSSLMVLLNAIEKAGISKELFSVFLKLLSPFAPHITDELWGKLGNKESIHLASWPSFDEKKVGTVNVQVAVQINGKIRATFNPSEPQNEEAVKREAEALPEVQKWILDKKIIKIIVVKNKIVSFVIAP